MPDNFTIEVRGLERLRNTTAGIAANAAKILGSELFKESEAIMTEAKKETPVDTGALRASGHVQLPKIEGDQVEVRSGFGGPAAPYAIHVHENLEASHPTGKSKFFEDPFRRRAKGLVERVGKNVSARLKELK